MDASPEINSKGFIKSRNMRFPKNQRFIRGKIRGDLRKNTYEYKEAESALRLVHPGDRVLELGGGIGYISTLIATNRKVESIHVYEANKELADYIRQTHEANGVTNATVHHALLGEHEGTANFFVRQNILASSTDHVEGSEVVRTDKVEVRNARAELNAKNANLLICDIEGAEAKILPLLDMSKVRAAMIELHPQWIGPEGVRAVFKAFHDAGMAYHAKLSNRKVVCFRRNWPLR